MSKHSVCRELDIALGFLKRFADGIVVMQTTLHFVRQRRNEIADALMRYGEAAEFLELKSRRFIRTFSNGKGDDGGKS